MSADHDKLRVLADTDQRLTAAKRPHVRRHLAAVAAELARGGISKREAARRLRVSVATLDQLLGVQKGEAA